MRPFNDIHIGDVYQTHLAWTNSKVNYTVVAKDILTKKMVKVRSSYQRPAMLETIWIPITHKILKKRIVKGDKENAKT